MKKRLKALTRTTLHLNVNMFVAHCWCTCLKTKASLCSCQGGLGLKWSRLGEYSDIDVIYQPGPCQTLDLKPEASGERTNRASCSGCLQTSCPYRKLLPELRHLHHEKHLEHFWAGICGPLLISSHLAKIPQPC